MKLLNMIKERGNNKVGLTMIITSLVMLFSLTILTWLANPLYLIQYVTLVALFGEWITLFIWIAIIIFSIYYYFNFRLEYLTKTRTIAFVIMSIAAMLFILSISLMTGTDHDGQPVNIVMNYVPVSVFYEITFTDFISQLAQPNSYIVYQGFNILNLGAILPIIIWVTILCGFFTPLLTLIAIMVVMYSIYVVMYDEWSVYLGKLSFGKTEQENIKTTKQADSIDLNEPTVEFQANFSPEELQKIEVIERVRKNMDRKTYEEVSEKIKEERSKLETLREEVIKKVQEEKEDSKYVSKISDTQRSEILSTLGYTPYNKAKASEELQNQERQKFLNEIYGQSRREEDIEDYKELVDDGFKTTEEAYDITDKTLENDYLKELADEAINSEDANAEVEKINKELNEVMSHEESLINSVKTTINSYTIKDETSEIIIDSLSDDVEIEEYISIPEDIESTKEQLLNINHVEAVKEQINDETDTTYSSIEEKE